MAQSEIKQEFKLSRTDVEAAVVEYLKNKKYLIDGPFRHEYKFSNFDPMAELCVILSIEYKRPG